jgi:DNA polymerase-1
MKKKYFIVDGNSFMHRSFNALPRLTNKDGFPTNAVTGTLNMIFSIIKKYDPENIVIAFDAGGGNFRHEMYEEYKATRNKMDDELRVQFGVIKEILDYWGIKKLEIKKVEADDSMGTLAKQAERAGYEVVIATSDKDMKQLVTENILILDTKDPKQKEPFGIKGVFDKEGVYPENITDKLALMGDKSDNIPGVAGVGEKTAIRLINDYGSAIAVYENLDKEKESLRNKLIESEEDFYLSTELVLIDTEVPLEVFEKYNQVDMNRESLANALYNYGLKKLIKSVGLEKELAKNQVSIDAKLVNLLENEKQFLEIKNSIYIYTEEEVLYIANSEDTVYHIKWEDLNENIKSFIFNNKEIYAFKSKDILKKINKSIMIKDISIIDYVINGAAKEKNLEDLFEYYTSQPIDFELIQNKVVAIKQISDKQNCINLNKEILTMELKLNNVLSNMEGNGVLINRIEMENYEKEISFKIEGIEKEIYKLSGSEFNLNSPKQVSKVLFTDLNLIAKKKSTSEDVLKTLIIQHPVVEKIIYYRQIAKLKSTYITGLLKHLTEENKIHTTFNQTIANTGRLTSTEPNLQSIPVRSNEGKKIRKKFIAKNKRKMIALDYSQIELRILADISKETKLIEAYKFGVDVHSLTASEILNIPLEEVTEDIRRIFKGINFGLIYGMSSRRLAEELDIDKKIADNYKKLYFEKYKEIKPFMEKELKFAKENDYVLTLSKRKIYIPNINSKLGIQRSHAERSANNASIQGTAAEIIKQAMVNVFEYIKDLNSVDLLLQIHDELVLEVDEEVAEKIAIDLQKIMQEAYTLSVPLVVNYKIADNY